MTPGVPPTEALPSITTGGGETVSVVSLAGGRGGSPLADGRGFVFQSRAACGTPAFSLTRVLLIGNVALLSLGGAGAVATAEGAG